jgi:peptidoglycan/LPS O-acetylase OafA/YrhL
MNRLSRPTALKIAAVLSFLLSAFTILQVFLIGAQAANQADGPGFSGVMFALALGVTGALAAYGAWNQMRWGIILTIIVNLINALLAAPGILAAPTPFLTVSATINVVLGVVIIVLCLWRDRKLATA